MRCERKASCSSGTVASTSFRDFGTPKGGSAASAHTNRTTPSRARAPRFMGILHSGNISLIPEGGTQRALFFGRPRAAELRGAARTPSLASDFVDYADFRLHGRRQMRILYRLEPA